MTIRTQLQPLLSGNELIEYLEAQGITEVPLLQSGAGNDKGSIPIAAVETEGAVLFADIAGYSRKAVDLPPAACAILTNHFFSWFQGVVINRYRGIIDKFIGDAIMAVFIKGHSSSAPFETALRCAKGIYETDVWGFRPHIGVAYGPIALAIVGSKFVLSASAMGHTVNVAARCASSVPENAQIRAAITDASAVQTVFGGPDNAWIATQPFVAKDLKNVGDVTLIDLEHTLLRTIPFDAVDVAVSVRLDAIKKGWIKTT